MTPEQAAATIDRMVFRPGWRFAASRLTSSHVYVMAEVDSFDTRYRDDFTGKLNRPMTLHPEAIIDVSGLDRDGLFCAVITQLVRPFDDHEDREFLAIRTGSRWYSPLHPHNAEGIAAWEKAGRK